MSLFSDSAPDQFGMFNRAFVTLFRIAAGDTWIDSLPTLGPDGNLEWKSALFICSFIVSSVWVVLQVSVAVLLDNFVTVSMRMENEDKESASREKKAARHFQNPLEPLIAKLANEYTNNANLSAKIRTLFQVPPSQIAVLPREHSAIAVTVARQKSVPQATKTYKHQTRNWLGGCRQVLDSNGSGGLTSQEFCAAMKKLVRTSILLAWQKGIQTIRFRSPADF